MFAAYLAESRFWSLFGRLKSKYRNTRDYFSGARGFLSWLGGESE